VDGLDDANLNTLFSTLLDRAQWLITREHLHSGTTSDALVNDASLLVVIERSSGERMRYGG
jgi:hypothetical protein